MVEEEERGRQDKNEEHTEEEKHRNDVQIHLFEHVKSWRCQQMYQFVFINNFPIFFYIGIKII